MTKAVILSALTIVLAGCSSGEPLAACKGPVFQLNADHWQAAPTDLENPRVASTP